MPSTDEEHELDSLHRSDSMEEEEREAGTPHAPTVEELTDNDLNGEQHTSDSEALLNRRTVRKLDFILLPFLALLFLLNSLDKSNIGNAETAGFTHDAGLSASDLNFSLAFFFAFFVALQPVGAALGRKFGMARWVPACMSLWGLCTLLHIWVRARWQLVVLRVIIACLEAGFYPTTVSYLSLFYTRYEFAVRLGFFYGQSAVAGALGGVLSWAVFSRFQDPQLPPPESTITSADSGEWRSWEVLFLIEGCTTVFVALVGFVWLPHSADTAWFYSQSERMWAEERIRLDRESTLSSKKRRASKMVDCDAADDEEHGLSRPSTDEDGGDDYHRLLAGHAEAAPIRRKMSAVSAISVTADSGLSRHDILSALFNYKIWHLLICNILSAIPATAFSVFLPLVIKQLSPSLNLSPAASNLLSAPPFAFGAVVLFIFMHWSDRSHQRLMPILWGLTLLLIGLILTIMSRRSSYILRYIGLCVLLSGSFIASPLTVAWLSNNTPEPGKRAILLGINGWGNLAGVFSAMLFTPEDEKTGYIRPFIVTLACVMASFAGYIAFWVLLVRENKRREDLLAGWTESERDREELLGDVPVPATGLELLGRRTGLDMLARRIGFEGGRWGDEKITFRYGL